jgi:Glycosyl hydrolase family 47
MWLLTLPINEIQEASNHVLLAELGSLSLQITRPSQLSDDLRYFDGILRITDESIDHQDKTKLPGIFPVLVNAKDFDFGNHSGYTLGAMTDCFYDNLSKVPDAPVALISMAFNTGPFSSGICTTRRPLATVS